jgi:hypothetical protein
MAIDCQYPSSRNDFACEIAVLGLIRRYWPLSGSSQFSDIRTAEGLFDIIKFAGCEFEIGGVDETVNLPGLLLPAAGPGLK